MNNREHSCYNPNHTQIIAICLVLQRKVGGQSIEMEESGNPHEACSFLNHKELSTVVLIATCSTLRCNTKLDFVQNF